MSKRKRLERPGGDLSIRPDVEIEVQAVVVEEVRAVPRWKQCPLCFNGDGGVGEVYCTKGRIQYLKCATCRLATWKHTITDF